MPDDCDTSSTRSCCAGPDACVFTKALLAQVARCHLAQRRPVGELDVVACTSPAARTDCETLQALLRERSTFALKLPRSGVPLMHARALQLQCGGVQALQAVLDADHRDVHALVATARQRHGSLAELPWADMVSTLVAWQPRRPRRGPQR